MNSDEKSIEIIVPPYAMNISYHITKELNRNGIEDDGRLLYLVSYPRLKLLGFLSHDSNFSM